MKDICPKCGGDVYKVFADQCIETQCPHCETWIYKCAGCDDIHVNEPVMPLICPVCQNSYCPDCVDEKFYCIGCSSTLYYDEDEHELVTSVADLSGPSEFEEEYWEEE